MKKRTNAVVTHALQNPTSILFKVEGVTTTEENPNAGELRLDMTRLHAEVLARATQHGLVQRISDRAAISRNTETGKPATADEKWAAMKELVDHYESGSADWGMRATRSGTTGAGVELLVECLMEIYPTKGREALKAWAMKRTIVDRAALLASEKIKPIADRLRAEAVEGLDAEAMLGELDDEDEVEAESEAE